VVISAWEKKECCFPYVLFNIINTSKKYSVIFLNNMTTY
jgi:hypothetical protein